MPFSVRLPARMDELIAYEARRTRRSKGAVIQALADEALRCRLFPRIAFRGDDYERRAWVIGTALDVWQIVQAYQDFGSAEKLVEESDLDESQVRLALAYCERFPEEIDEAIGENRRPLAELREQYPTIDIVSPAR